jgi:hypothetical protein
MLPLPIIAVQLGRIGDILNVLPPCKFLGIRYMLVHPDFVCALGGQSYVEPAVWSGDFENLSSAVAYAKAIASDVRVPQLAGKIQPEGLPPRSRQSFVMDQWDRLQPGLGDKWGTLPLEFDKRDKAGEQLLLRKTLEQNYDDLPMLLVNLTSKSSPFENGIDGMIMKHLTEGNAKFRFFIVDLGLLREEKFCNLLALYECAAGLITADTSTLHLARATPSLRVFQFVRPDHDATPVFDASQPYSYAEFDKIDEFVASLRR